MSFFRTEGGELSVFLQVIFFSPLLLIHRAEMTNPEYLSEPKFVPRIVPH